MELLAMHCILFAIFGLIFSNEATHLRSRSRWSRSLAARSSHEDSPALAMGMSRSQGGKSNHADAVNAVDVNRVALDQAAGSVVGPSSSALSSSSPIIATSTITIDSTVTLTSTITPGRILPTDRYAGGEKWLPKGGGIDVRKWVSPETPHRYTSNGTCVNMRDYKRRCTSYIISYLKVAAGLRCKFYLLPNCDTENVLLMDDDLHRGGFWNATQLWTINIISSFQCWPKQCYQPSPPLNYSIEPMPTFICTERIPSTALPTGFDSEWFRQTIPASSSFPSYNISRSWSQSSSELISSAPAITSSSGYTASIISSSFGSSVLHSEVLSSAAAIVSSSMANVDSSSAMSTSTITLTTTYAIGLGRRTADRAICPTHTVTHTITTHGEHALATTASTSSAVRPI